MPTTSEHLRWGLCGTAATNLISSSALPVVKDFMMLYCTVPWTLSQYVFIQNICILQKNIQVVPGRAGGGSFKRKKNYIAKKEFAYRMCARWPTIAMSKLFFWVWTKLLPLHGCDVMRFGVMCLWFDLLSSDVASCEVICNTTPVLLCTTKNYNVLLQDYSNVLLRTTTYYSRTTLYYKVLIQYYSVLRSTTLYCKVLRQ